MGYTYTIDDLKNYHPDTIKRLYEYYEERGELDKQPALVERYHFHFHGEAPDVSTYKGVKRDETPSTKWDKKAEDGYEVDPDELRNLARDLESDLNALKSDLAKIRNHTGFTAEGAGGGTNGQKMASLANNASRGFGEYFGAIEAGIQGVIQRLKTTADRYEAGHQQTKSSVDNVNL